MRPPLALALAAVVVLAGCTAAPVDADGRPLVFHLTVVVVGVGEDVGPVESARVAANVAGGDRVTNVTDASGTVAFALERGASVTLDAAADGWVDASTVSMRLGGGNAAEVVAEIGRALGCAFTLGAMCFTDEDLVLDGEEARVTVHLVPPELTRVVTVRTSPGASPAPSHAVEPPTWWSAPVPAHADAPMQSLLMQHVRVVDATMAWSNALLDRGDYELGLACAPDAPAAVSSTDSGAGHLLAEGERVVELSWEPPVEDARGVKNRGWASMFDEAPCATLHAGPVEDSATNAVDVTTTVRFTFRPAVQVPDVSAS